MSINMLVSTFVPLERFTEEAENYLMQKIEPNNVIFW